MGEENAGETAHALRLQEIELHEPLDRALARAIGEIHPFGNLALQVEGQPVLCAPRNDVHVAAHREQEAFCAAETAVFDLRHKAGVDQLGGARYPVDELADPV